MKDNFEEVMAKRSNTELLKIVTGPGEKYQPAALEAAKKEMAKRNLTADQMAIIQKEVEHEQRLKKEKSNQPLEDIWKILTFIFPGLLQLLFSGMYKAEGYQRKATELVRWTMYGFGFYLGLIVLINLLGVIW